MHEQWEELIPFYVAQTLAPYEVVALERHLNTCAVCQTSVREWSFLAAAVREEAIKQARELPPLSAAVRRYLSKLASAPLMTGDSGYQPAVSQPANIPVRRAQPMRLTLAAAIVTLVLFGGLLVYMAAQLTALTREKNGHPPTSIAAVPTMTGMPGGFGAPVDTSTDEGIVTAIIPTMPPIEPTLTLSTVLLPTANLGQPIPTMPVFYPPTATPDLSQPTIVTGLGGGRPQSFAPLASTGPEVALNPTDVNCYVQPPADSTQITLYLGPGESFGVLGAFGPNDPSIVAAVSDNRWYLLNFLAPSALHSGWVSKDAITIGGNCGNLPIICSLGYPVASLCGTPTPSPSDLSSMIGMGYVFITTENVGAIPSGSRVRISSATQDANGDWLYLIVTQDEQLSAQATASELAWAYDATPGPTPTSPIDESGWSGYDMITTTDVGAIPANTRVRITSGWFNGIEWRYTIVTEDNQTTAEAGLSQLTYAPNFTPGPTPTAMYGRAIGTGGAVVMTLVTVGNIPPNTPVTIGSAWFDGTTWHYDVSTADGLSGEALENQLGFVNFGIAMPTPSAGYILKSGGTCTDTGATFTVTNIGDDMTSPQRYDVSNMDNLTDSQTSGTVQLASGESMTVNVTTSVTRLILVVTTGGNAFATTSTLDCGAK
jgi:putative zinc finger protein